MNRGKNLLPSAVSDESLTGELLPGVPIVEICEQGRILIENHQGVIAYGCSEIQIKVRYGRICVCGENLRLKRMNKAKLVICGKICTVHLQGRG